MFNSSMIPLYIFLYKIPLSLYYSSALSPSVIFHCVFRIKSKCHSLAVWFVTVHSLSLPKLPTSSSASLFSEHLTVAGWIHSCSQHIWRSIFSSSLPYLECLCLFCFVFYIYRNLIRLSWLIFFTLPMKLLLKYSIWGEEAN